MDDLEIEGEERGDGDNFLEKSMSDMNGQRCKALFVDQDFDFLHLQYFSAFIYSLEEGEFCSCDLLIKKRTNFWSKYLILEERGNLMFRMSRLLIFL